MKKTVLIFAAGLALALGACTRPEQARDALEAAGYTDVEAGGYAWFNCSDDDMFRTRFDATGPNGQRVEGAVCSSWLKGATIRTTRVKREQTP